VVRHHPVSTVAAHIALLIFALPLSAAEPASVDMLALLDETGATLEWDEFTRTGVLWGEESVGFTPGDEIAVVGFSNLIRVEPIVYRRGQLLVPDTTYDTLAQILGRRPVRIRPVTAIVIDAGHGGWDPGTNRWITVNGEPTLIMEKDLVLDIARRTQSAVQPLLPETRVVLSRQDDTFVELEDRTDFANSLREDAADNVLFVSIHANASRETWADARGVEIHYLISSHRRQVLDQEMTASLDRDISTILNDIKEQEYTVESVRMGRAILDSIAAELPGTPIDRGIRPADFFVVREARMPSILIEVGFISNRAELAQLRTASYRQQLAEAIARGLEAYVVDFETLR
jgi:N-acetylmuramoyl-L-alanine amidase